MHRFYHWHAEVFGVTASQFYYVRSLKAMFDGKGMKPCGDRLPHMLDNVDNRLHVVFDKAENSLIERLVEKTRPENISAVVMAVQAKTRHNRARGGHNSSPMFSKARVISAVLILRDGSVSIVAGRSNLGVEQSKAGNALGSQGEGYDAKRGEAAKTPNVAGAWRSDQGDRIVVTQNGSQLSVKSHRASGGVRWRASGKIDASGNITLRSEYTKSKKIVNQLGHVTSSGRRVIHRNGNTAKTFPWSRSSTQQNVSKPSGKGSSIVGAWSATVGKHKTSWMFTKGGMFLTNKGKKGKWKYEDNGVRIDLDNYWIKLSYPIRYTGTKGVSSGGHKVEATRK